MRTAPAFLCSPGTRVSGRSAPLPYTVQYELACDVPRPRTKDIPLHTGVGVMEGDWSSREGRLDLPDYCVPERDTVSSVHLSQVSLDGGYGGSEACSSEIFHHCQQPSYAHSEGYYSYVSSTDSITPFIDRLKRELEFTEIHENCSNNSHGGTKWEESETDGFREKNCAKENDSVWQVRGSNRDLTSYRAAGGSTRLSSPPLPSTDPKLTYLSRVPVFHDTSYESVDIIERGPRLTTSQLASQSSPNSRLQTDNSCHSVNHKPTRVQSALPSAFRTSDIVHPARSHAPHSSEREATDARPSRLINGTSCETPDTGRGLITRDSTNSVRQSRVQPLNHAPRIHSNQISGSETPVGFSGKVPSALNESCRIGSSRSDSLNSSFRSQCSSADSSSNHISRPHSTSSSESSLVSRLYSSQASSNESANIARSSRIPPPQRHLSQSVLYLSADHRKLFPISTYQPEPPRVVGAVSVSERVVELESRFGGLKALQKKALLSFYQRHQVAPPPPPRRASSASDYLQLKGCLDTASSSSSSSSHSHCSKDLAPAACSTSLLKDTRQHHSRSCGSLSGISGPVIVGRSISVDDWVPARPPKGAHLRPRPPSPEPPPPPSSPPQQYSDEPLPPPPGPDELPPSLPSRHPSPGPQVPTTKIHSRPSDNPSSSDQQSRPVNATEPRFSSTDASLALDTRPQKLIESPMNHKNTLADAKKPQYNCSVTNRNRSTPGILERRTQADSPHKEVRSPDPQPLSQLDNSEQRKNKCTIETLPRYHRTISSNVRSTPILSEYHPRCSPPIAEHKDAEPVQELRIQCDDAKNQTILAESISSVNTSESAAILHPGNDPPESHLSCNHTTAEPVKGDKLAPVSTERIELCRPPSRDSLSQPKSEEDKVKKNMDESKPKESRQILRKTSFRCSEKIQQSIDSLHNSLRGSIKDVDSSKYCSTQALGSCSPLKLSTNSLAQLDCITLTEQLSSSRTSLFDVGVEKEEDVSRAVADHALGTSHLDSLLSVGTLQQKKEELVTRLSRKLSVLRAEAAAVAEETTANEDLGEAVVERVSAAWGPREASRLRSHVADLGRLTALLLTLTTRLARADNALLALSSCHPDKGALETKRDRLAGQLEEARRLKEKVDKRNETVTSKLKERLTADEYSDFMHFVSLKSKLLLDSREIADKIKLGEEQLQALQMTLSAVT